MLEFERPRRQAYDGRSVEMIVAPVAPRKLGRFEFAALGQSEMCGFTPASVTLDASRVDPRGSCMTASITSVPIA